MGREQVCLFAMPDGRPPTIDSVNDDELEQLEHATPGPWNDNGAEGFGSVHPHRPAPRGRGDLSKPRHGRHVAKPVKSGQPTSAFLPVLPSAGKSVASGKKKKTAPDKNQLDASSVTEAYDALMTRSRTMEMTREANQERRQLHQTALYMGLEHLSDTRVRAERDIIRFSTLKNEIDIFQQYLDPFVFEMRTPHDHCVKSSVYRHFMRMQAIQDMGIPIYSIGNFAPEESDKIIMPRTFQSFYRRIRRRNAAEYIDVELIPRPKPRSPHRQEQ